ncbi:unnamed protein product, partial [Adineta steineri]
MFRVRRRRKLVPPISYPYLKRKSKHQSRCITWINIALGALIPMMIGVGTIIIAIVNQNIEDKRRQQDQDLAYLTRLQDQQLADALYYQGVYKTYIEDISNILFKLNNSFIDIEKKMKYIRTKTLTALDELDWQHRSRLFLFLYETGLLSSSNTTNISLDLSGANFVNISISSTKRKKFHFNKLKLLSVDLTNASFIDCQFDQGADFSDSLMVDAKFTQSTFKCSKTYFVYTDPMGEIHIHFDRSNLERSDFTDTYLCDASFIGTNLASSTLSGITFQGWIKFQRTNLTEMELMTCLPCSKHKTHAPKQLRATIKSSFGVFKFIEQDGGYNQTQKFRDLKKSIRVHLTINLHIWCTKEEQKEKEEADDFMRKNEKAGYNIGRIALFCIRTGLGGLKFVETINLIDLCGGTVGNYRHSRYIYDRLRDVMAEEMKLKITEYLARMDPVLQHPVPFGITFDKLCAALMRKYSYGKQYEILLETAQYLGEDILAPKQFHTTRFVSSERRVYETVLRDWRSLYEVQEEEDQLNALLYGDVSARTRRAHAGSHQGAGDEITFK